MKNLKENKIDLPRNAQQQQQINILFVYMSDAMLKSNIININELNNLFAQASASNLVLNLTRNDELSFDFDENDIKTSNIFEQRVELLKRVPLLIFYLLLGFLLASSIICLIVLKLRRSSHNKNTMATTSNSRRPTRLSTSVVPTTTTTRTGSTKTTTNATRCAEKNKCDYLLDSPIVLRRVLYDESNDVEAQKSYVKKYNLEYLYDEAEVKERIEFIE